MTQEPVRLIPRGTDPAAVAAREAVESAIRHAIQAHRVLLVRDAQGRERTVQPHAVFRSHLGKRDLHSYQVGGYSSSGKLPQWRNLPVEAIAEVTVTDEPFHPRSDFNPTNTNTFAPGSIEIMVDPPEPPQPS